MKGWYDEKKDWHYSSAGCNIGRMCKHFTQVVWRETKKLGLGYAQNNGRAYIVVRYSPGGNFHPGGQKVEWYNRNVQLEGTEQIHLKEIQPLYLIYFDRRQWKQRLWWK